MSERALHAQVHARVQGAGFGYLTQMTARQLGITGWVRNRMDGSVEVRAEGPADAIDSFLAYLQQGPASANVTGVDSRSIEPEHAFDTFSVR